ncbi:hypothetical protein [Rhizobium sp. YS-1r]|uniref:hypothetical protein n=1 Tax=Rhizobium sp. YS-1r TaxID=1532558 RepID=UPI001AEC5E40|nr:hypothetical protein [Rhizobium sp. YS-1r]
MISCWIFVRVRSASLPIAAIPVTALFEPPALTVLSTEVATLSIFGTPFSASAPIAATACRASALPLFAPEESMLTPIEMR